MNSDDSIFFIVALQKQRNDYEYQDIWFDIVILVLVKTGSPVGRDTMSLGK